MSGGRASHLAAVYVVMDRADTTLFLMRGGTGYRDGEYGLPSGRVEPGELLHEAAAREAREETGVVVGPEDLSFAHLTERHTPTGNWLDFFFTCRRWTGEPVNAEPEKCPHGAWLRRDDPTISDYVRNALKTLGEGTPFSRYEDE